MKEELKIEGQSCMNEKDCNFILKRLQLICDTVPDMIWAKNMEKTYIFANIGICKHLLNAKDTNEPIGKTDLFFMERERSLYPDNPNWFTFGEICQDSDQVIIDTKHPGQFDESGNVSGNFLHLSVNKAPIFDENGNMIGIVGCARDITQHRVLEQKVLKNKANYKAILDNLQDGFFQTDLAGNILFVSVSALEMLGYTRDEVIGTPFRRYNVNPEEEGVWLRKLLNAGGKLYEQEMEMINKNNEIITISINVQLQYDETGNVIGATGIFKDITESKRRLAEIYKLYHVVEGSQNALMIIEPDGIISYANNAVLTTARCPEYITLEEFVLGRKAKNFLSFDGNHTLSSVCEIVHNTGKWFGEGYLYCEYGFDSRIPIEIVFSKIDDKERIYVVVSFYDISERLALEKKVRVQSEKYERLQLEMIELVEQINQINKEKFDNITQLEANFDKSIKILTSEGANQNGGAAI